MFNRASIKERERSVNDREAHAHKVTQNFPRIKCLMLDISVCVCVSVRVSGCVNAESLCCCLSMSLSVSPCYSFSLTICLFSLTFFVCPSASLPCSLFVSPFVGWSFYVCLPMLLPGSLSLTSRLYMSAISHKQHAGHKELEAWGHDSKDFWINASP